MSEYDADPYEMDDDPTVDRLVDASNPYEDDAAYAVEAESSLERFRAHQPLTDDDPVKVGDFWLDARLASSAAGVAFCAHEDHGDAVMLLLLNEGAASDPAARARFAGEINAMHIDTVVARGGEGQDEGRLHVRFRGEHDDPPVEGLPALAPWAALAFDGSKAAVAEGRRVLDAVDLHGAASLSSPRGPDYRLHWLDRTNTGPTRVWPLGWPGRRDRAGWISIFTSWLIMMLLTALGLLLAILIFQNAPLVSPPPPVPSEASESGSGSGSPQSGSPQSPPPSASGGEQGATPDDSFTPTMGEPDDKDSGGGGEPSPNRRL